VIVLEGGHDRNALGASSSATIAELEASGRVVQRQAKPLSPAAVTGQPMEKTR
jgi:proline racemase